MIDQLPKDIPAVSSQSASPRESSPSSSSNSERFSDVVKKISEDNKKETKDTTEKSVKKDPVRSEQKEQRQSVSSFETTRSGKQKPTDETAVEADVDATGEKGEADASQPAQTIALEIPELTTKESIRNENSSVVAAKKKEMPVIPVELDFVEDTGSKFQQSALKQADEPEVAPLAASVVANPVKVDAEESLKAAKKTAVTFKDPAVTVIKSALTQTGEHEVPGEQRMSARFVTVEEQEAANEKLLKAQTDAVKSESVETRQTELQRNMLALAKERANVKMSAFSSGSASVQDTDPTSVGSITSVRDIGITAPATETVTLSERAAELKTQSLPLALDRRLQAGIQTQSLSNLRFMIENNQRAATIQLHPAELGALKVGIDIQSDHLNVHINAAQNMTKEALEMLLPKMRNQLLQQGFSGVDISLSGGQSDNQLAQQQQEFSGERMPGNGAEGNQSYSSGAGTVEAVQSDRVNVRSSQMIDLFA